MLEAPDDRDEDPYKSKLEGLEDKYYYRVIIIFKLTKFKAFQPPHRYQSIVLSIGK